MIRFYIKAFVLKLLSIIPGGILLYNQLQIHVTGSTLPESETVNQKRQVGETYLDILSGMDKDNLLKDGCHLEVGSGWNPVIPLVFYTAGCNDQVLTDIKPVLCPGHLPRIVRVLALGLQKSQWAARGLPEMDDPAKYLKAVGVSYQAPCIPPYPLKDNSMSLITATQVLQYFYLDQLHQVLAEVYRLLRPGGVFIATLQLTDEAAYMGAGISKFNFLRFSNTIWKAIFKNAITSQSRLRARDYQQAVSCFSFKTCVWQTRGGTPEDVAELRKIRMHHIFHRYTEQELALTDLFFVLEKPNNDKK